LSADVSLLKNSQRQGAFRQIPGLRIVAFGCVGGACLAFQLALLHLLLVGFSVDSRLGESVANAIAFLLSTQVNFLLSRSTTWRDRRIDGMVWSARVKQQFAFNLLALVGLTINQAVFWLTSGRIGAVPASGLGTVAASAVTLVMSAVAVFPHASRTNSHGLPIRALPAFPAISLPLPRFRLLRRWWAVDRYEVIVFGFGLISAIVNFLYYFAQGHMLEYDDSISHPMIARRVLDSPTPGLSQIGGVWPPLPHLLTLPFIWNDWMYYSGTAGSIESMLCYIVVLVFTYRIARLIGCGPVPALLAAGIMAVNPNMRYMQSISMTELPLLCGIVLAVYFLLQWSRTESVWHMTGLIGAVVFASATRYEGWALWGAVFVAIAYVMIRRGWERAKQIDYGILYLVFSGFFIPLWAIWNKVIIQTGWLGFTNSEYASSSNWVTDNEPSNGHPWTAIKTYWYAMSNIGGTPLLLLSVAGLAGFLLRDRLKPGTSGVLVLLFPAPFFAFMLWAGQRPLHVPEVSGDMYNIRFALQMMPFMALMAASLVDEIVYFLRDRWYRVLMVSIAAVAVVAITPLTTITLDEPLAAQQYDNLRADQRVVGEWIDEHYTGGTVLMQTTGNEATVFYSHLPLERVIYEGTNENDVWRNALADPGTYVDWIFMRVKPGNYDKVAAAVVAIPGALDGFRLIYSTPEIQIYARNS
jgi:putative flippase GtrA